MQISFNQDEIKDALLEALEKQVQLQPGQTTRIAFDLDDPKDIIAYVEIVRGDAKGKPTALTPKQVETVKSDAAQTQTRGRGKAAQAAPAPVVATPAAEVIAAASEAPATVESNDPPFDVESKTEPKPETETASAAAISTGEERVDPAQEETKPAEAAASEAPKAAATSIFPNAGSSAPAIPAAATPAPTGKSLFANLTRPSGDAAKLN